MRNNTDWILTYTGRKFYPLQPELEEIHVLDIAHALSNMCRFTGHVRDFYSVAQHSVLVAERIWDLTKNQNKALCGLLHDASEAYICDIARPVKLAKEFEVYRQIERNLQSLIDRKYKTDSCTNFVTEADNYLLQVEAYFLMPDCPDWSLTITKPLDIDDFQCWSPGLSKQRFLSAFLDFGGEQKRINQ